MSSKISDAIAENAGGPKQVESDGVKVTQHSLKDQIAADRHVAGKVASQNPARGLRFTRMIPPGTSA